MAISKSNSAKKEITWTAILIKQLRGKRTQTEFGELLGVPKNTVWRWETGQAAPDRQHARRLSTLAEREHFLKNWKLVGSGRILGDIEEGSRGINSQLTKSINRSARQLIE